MKTKKIILFLITLAIGLAAFSLIGGETNWSTVWESFSVIRWWQVLVLCLLMLGSILTLALSWKTILEEKKGSIPFFPLLKIFVVGFSLSYLTPMSLVGGEALKAYLLHEKLKISWKKGIISIVLQEIINFFVLIPIIIFGLGSFFFLGGRLSKKLGLLALVVILAVLIFFFLILLKSQQHKSLITSLVRMIGLEQILETDKMKTILGYEKEAFRFFNTRHRDFRKAIGFSVLQYFFCFLQATFLIYFLTGRWTINGGLIAQAFSGLSSFLMLPASIGSLEIVEGFAFQALGLSLSLAVIFSLIWRGLRLLVCVWGGIIALQFMRESSQTKIKQFKDFYLHGKQEDS